MSEAAHRTAGADGSRADGGDDAAVIARSLHSPECFGTIFHRHAPAIYRYIARRLGPHSAEDLVAETFLVAFRRRTAAPSTSPRRGRLPRCARPPVPGCGRYSCKVWAWVSPAAE